jgi:hypothetical protein
VPEAFWVSNDGMPEGPTVPLPLSRPALKALLQRGVGIPDGAGLNVRAFLEETLGIEAAYVEERLQTVFLDGHPVDDLDHAVVGPGAVVALSGAMPGLAGATMRRGGYYARLREGISHEKGGSAAEAAAGAEAVDEASGPSPVIVKLFNRALADLAEILASRPLLVRVEQLDGLDPAAARDLRARADGCGAGLSYDGWVPVALTSA